VFLNLFDQRVLILFSLPLVQERREEKRKKRREEKERKKEKKRQKYIKKKKRREEKRREEKRSEVKWRKTENYMLPPGQAFFEEGERRSIARIHSDDPWSYSARIKGNGLDRMPSGAKRGHRDFSFSRSSMSGSASAPSSSASAPASAWSPWLGIALKKTTLTPSEEICFMGCFRSWEVSLNGCQSLFEVPTQRKEREGGRGREVRTGFGRKQSKRKEKEKQSKKRKAKEKEGRMNWK